MGKQRFHYGCSRRDQEKNGFPCAHCGAWVCGEPGTAGVQNRNHCPYCLWSRHVDLYQAGDRLSACKSVMQPVGVTLKATRKKYGPGRGELMLVHLCLECQDISINRIAADDDPDRLFAIFADSARLDARLRLRLDACRIVLLDAGHTDMVQAQLFGKINSPARMILGPA